MIKLIAIEPKDSYRLRLRFSDPASKIAARPRTAAPLRMGSLLGFGPRERSLDRAG